MMGSGRNLSGYSGDDSKEKDETEGGREKKFEYVMGLRGLACIRVG